MPRNRKLKTGRRKIILNILKIDIMHQCYVAEMDIAVLIVLVTHLGEI